ncbi:MAG: hypothetical protein WD489_08730 [Rhodovibrionaceae bacterium]
MQRPNPYLRRLLTWPLAIRFIIGCFLILGGIFSFLPVLGIWMLPLGVVVMFSGSQQIRMPMILWFRRLRGWIALHLTRRSRSPAGGKPPLSATSGPGWPDGR